MKKMVCCSAKLNTSVDLKCFKKMGCPWVPLHRNNLSWALGISLRSSHLHSGLLHNAARRPSVCLLGTLHMHSKEEKAQAWQQIELNIFFCWGSNKTSRSDLFLPEVMIAVSQESNWCQTVNPQTFCTLASHTLKIQLVQAPHIAIATMKPNTLKWLLWTLPSFFLWFALTVVRVLPGKLNPHWWITAEWLKLKYTSISYFVTTPKY